MTMTEARIQQEICIFYRNNYCLEHHDPRSLIISVPNEGNPFLTQTGLLSGTSDLIIFHRKRATILPAPMLLVLFVEVKTEKGKQSENQIKFEEMIKKMHDKHKIMSYYLVRSLEQFQDLIHSL